MGTHRHFVWLGLLAFALVVAVACSSAVEYRPTLRTLEPREPDCSVRVIRGYVPEPYIVLGRMEVSAFAASSLPKTVGEVRALVREQVCKAGGNGFFAMQNAQGRYSGGLVLHILPDGSNDGGGVQP